MDGRKVKISLVFHCNENCTSTAGKIKTWKPRKIETKENFRVF